MKAVTAEQMRTIEQRAVNVGVSLDALMENAGLAVADFVTAALNQKQGVYGSSVTVLVGPGNNGSDGLVAARHLSRRGVKVRAFGLANRPDPDEKRVLAEEAGTEFVSIAKGDGEARASFKESMSNSDLVLDAVLGTGQAREIGEPLAGLLSAVRETGTENIAVDLPTGMNAGTGSFDRSGLRASTTLMLGYPKIGPLVTAGTGVCGEIKFLDIGIPSGLDDDVSSEFLTGQLAVELLPVRAEDANKGSFGRTLILGGSTNYIGAPVLATRAAVRSGAGLVYLATGESVYRTIAGAVEEAIYLPLPINADGEFRVRDASVELLSRIPQMSSVLIGPGLGQSTATVQLVGQLVRNLPVGVPTVIDADALNILSPVPDWSGPAQKAGSSIILTPHPGEMARLLDMSVAEVQADRLGAALTAAERFNATVVLKGAATIIATPDGQVRISLWVNPGLAKGGTGDVLAGLVAGLLAQIPGRPFDAASLAVHIHGLAGDFARRQIGERGMTAGDVAGLLPAAFQHLEKRSP